MRCLSAAVSVNCLPKVTSCERRGRADGPASDRGNFTTAPQEKQPPAGGRLAGPADGYQTRPAPPPRSAPATDLPERGMNGDVAINADATGSFAIRVNLVMAPSDQCSDEPNKPSSPRAL